MYLASLCMIKVRLGLSNLALPGGFLQALLGRESIRIARFIVELANHVSIRDPLKRRCNFGFWK